MKLLNEEQQLVKRKEEIWNLIKYQENELSKLEKRKSKYQNNWFRSVTDLIIIDYEIEAAKSILNALKEYFYDLIEKIETLKPNNA